MRRPSLTIIGAGKAGQALGRLFVEHRVFQIKQILNSSLQSSALACKKMGAGDPIENSEQLQMADVYLLGVPDDCIKGVSESLLGNIAPGAIVFHLSGALLAEEMDPLKQQQNRLASVHPAFTFTGEARDLSGIFCTLEGDVAACELLSSILTNCGLKAMTITPQAKILYHGFLVMACNYFVALCHSSKKGLESIGFEPQQALDLLRPLVSAACHNIFDKGPTAALTGPIERGDVDLVTKQCKALSDHDLQMGQIYRMLGDYTTQVAMEKGPLELCQFEALKRLFRSGEDEQN